jgi:hypothetical protein
MVTLNTPKSNNSIGQAKIKATHFAIMFSSLLFSNEAKICKNNILSIQT